jgi:NCS1 family nucleobase:cation symporter-1
MSSREQAARIEGPTIQPIPLDGRHGRPRDLFTVWFGSNIMLLTVVTGSLAASVYHLPFCWAVPSLILGNLVGAVFMALHAAQGPILGVPQMVQTRGQFGSLGSLLVVALVVVMYLGFFASNLVLGGQALHLLLPPLSEAVGIGLGGVLAVIGAILGYDLIHAYARAMTYLAGAALVLAFVWVFLVGHVSVAADATHVATLNGVLGTVSVAALWQIAYAPYVSDYSRYLPKETGSRAAFWSSYWGCTIGSVLPMILGAAIGLYANEGQVVGALAEKCGGVAIIVLSALTLAMAVTNAMNLYCATLSTLTIGQTLVPSWSPRARARSIAALVLLAFTLALALFAKNSFLVKYTDFILLLLYVLVPWTAINLVDYYFVQHGAYDVESFLRQDGGIYGRVNIPAVGCYAFGILVQVPFMASPLYTGPVATLLGGADLSWLVGLALTSPLYYILARRIPVPAPGVPA